MRLEFSASPAQRASLRAQRARLETPTEVLGLLRPMLASGVAVTGLTSSVESVHPDRFVLRARIHTRQGGWSAYALKAYADDFGARVASLGRQVAASRGLAPGGVCPPLRYIGYERVVVFPWVEGECLAAIADERATALYRAAGCLAARFHRLGLVPEPPTSPDELVAYVGERYERLRRRWPDAAPVLEPLVGELEDALRLLDPAAPALVHGDLWAGQCLWTGDGLVLLDLDAFGYADPAYDVGHFLAQLDRERLCDPAAGARVEHWAAAFLDAYRAVMPTVSARNIAFYRALTLARKILTVRRLEPTRWPRLAAELASGARAALEEAASAPAGTR